MSKRKNNRDRKRYFVGMGLGLILVFVIYVLLGCFPFGKANQNAEQQSLMPAVSKSYEPSFDDIVFVELQTSAVIIDMERYLGWFPEEKEMLKKASVKAISDLKTIKDYLRQLSFTGDLIELKDMRLAIIDMFVQIYDGIELKRPLPDLMDSIHNIPKNSERPSRNTSLLKNCRRILMFQIV